MASVVISTFDEESKSKIYYTIDLDQVAQVEVNPDRTKSTSSCVTMCDGTQIRTSKVSAEKVANALEKHHNG